MSTDIASEQAEAQGDAFQRAKERRWNRDATRTCRVLKEYAGKLHGLPAFMPKGAMSVLAVYWTVSNSQSGPPLRQLIVSSDCQ